MIMDSVQQPPVVLTLHPANCYVPPGSRSGLSADGGAATQDNGNIQMHLATCCVPPGSRRGLSEDTSATMQGNEKNMSNDNLHINQGNGGGGKDANVVIDNNIVASQRGQQGRNSQTVTSVGGVVVTPLVAYSGSEPASTLPRRD